jgi:hypothetical protein
MNFNNVLKNKYLYYAAVALMVINVLGYVSLGSIECVLVLGGAAYLANHFTKNRTVDIFIGLFVSNILFGCGRLREGLENGSDKLDKAGAGLVADGMHKKKKAKTQAEVENAVGQIQAGTDAQKKAKKCKEGDEKCKKEAAGKQGFF